MISERVIFIDASNEKKDLLDRVLIVEEENQLVMEKWEICQKISEQEQDHPFFKKDENNQVSKILVTMEGNKSSTIKYYNEKIKIM